MARIEKKDADAWFTPNMSLTETAVLQWDCNLEWDCSCNKTACCHEMVMLQWDGDAAMGWWCCSKMVMLQWDCKLRWDGMLDTWTPRGTYGMPVVMQAGNLAHVRKWPYKAPKVHVLGTCKWIWLSEKLFTFSNGKIKNSANFRVNDGGKLNPLGNLVL